MATFAQTWALAQVVRYAMRTQSSVVACWLRESVCVMNLRPSFTTRYQTERLKKGYFLAFFFDDGRASVREWKEGPDVLGVPRECFWILKMAANLPRRVLRWILTLNPQRRFFCKGVVWWSIGMIVEIYRRLVSSMDPKQSAVQETD